MKFLKILVLALNSFKLLRYNHIKLHFLFLLNANSSKYSQEEWVK